MEITDETKNAIHVAQALAKSYSNKNFGPAHLLKGLLHKSTGLYPELLTWNMDMLFLEEWTDVRIEAYPKGRLNGEPSGDDDVSKVFNEAENISIKAGKDKICPLSLLESLSLPGVGFTYEQLKTFPLNADMISSKAKSTVTTIKSSKNNNDGHVLTTSGNISNYCTDMLAKARTSELPLCLGRNNDLVTLFEILCRRTKTNIILTGEPGVGKTAMAWGIAQEIASGNVPLTLKNIVMFEADCNTILSGATYKGEVEDRFRNIISELSAYEHPVLFIDDFHILFDKNQGYQGVINIIRSELAKGAITLIGTALTDEYRKKLEPETSLMRWCEVVQVAEPSTEKAFEIVKGTIQKYTQHHNVLVPDEVISESIRLSKRYIKERCLPDTALDVLDRTMAALSYMHQMAPIQAGAFSEGLNKDEGIGTDEERLSSAYQAFLGSLNYLTRFAIEGWQRGTGLSDIRANISDLLALGDKKDINLETAQVASTISKMCGIPAGKILSGEKEKLINMESFLQSKVIGQDQAIKVLADSILESRSGLARPGQPIGSFFLLGPTGTGKTELAKQLADYLFQNNKAFIRFDMSEFKEEHSAALLYGSPPGYVGYEEGGLLVSKIRQQPYAVVLFDEIEKAHTSVFDIFLQILDEGKITDKLGRSGDFSNAVVLFTSNIGSKQIVQTFNANGSFPSQEELTTLMTNYFRPEFLGRLSGIVPFAPIAKQNVIKILKLQLQELENALANQKITFEITDGAANLLADKGYTPEFGARPLRSIIRAKLKTPLSRMIITGALLPGGHVKVKPGKEGDIEINCIEK